MESCLYKGIVVEVESPAIVKVWIPSKQATPIGQFEYLGDNVGSNLDIELIKKTAIRCRIMTQLTSGAWWNYDALRNKSSLSGKGPIDYRLNPTARPEIESKPRITRPNNASLAPVQKRTMQTGGINTAATRGLPPGSFPKITPNQHVLVAFVNSSLPIVIGTLPTDLEIEATIG